MQALTAALVLAWIVLVVQAFAMTGLLRQIRDIQDLLRRGVPAPGTLGAAPSRDLPEAVRPRAGSEYAALLLVEEGCPICAEVAPVFEELAGDHTGLDCVLLSHHDAEKWRQLTGLRHVVDAAAFQLLDPGWRPALVLIDAKGEVVAVEPAGSADSLRAVINEDLGAPA